MAEKRAMKDSEINKTGLAACSDHDLQSYSLEILIVLHEEPSLTCQVLQNTNARVELEVQGIY